MKNLSKTFIEVGLVLSWIAFGILVFSGLVCIVLGVLPPIHEAIREGYPDTADANGFPSADAAVIFYISMLVSAGVICLLFVPLVIVNIVLSKKVLNEPNRGAFIACIIIGAMCSRFTLVGGIVGLIAFVKQRRNKDIIDQ